MAFNINDIRGQLSQGGARSTLFQVSITNPINPAGDLKTPFMCRAAEIPGSTLGFVDVPYFGRKIKVAGDRVFQPWTVTIMNDEDFLVRNAMEQWSNAINSLQGNLRTTGTSAPLAYKQQALVTQYSKSGNILRQYQFNGVFPTDIAPITVDWNNTDMIEEFTVTFQYDYWEVLPGVTGNAGGV